MSILKALFGKMAPTHHAEIYHVRHDGTYNLVEARRGRGKTYGAVSVGFNWLVHRMPDMLAGKAPYAKWGTNIKVEKLRLAYEICFHGHMHSLFDALDFVEERYVYLDDWDKLLELYDSLIIGDEWNRNANVYENDKESQKMMLIVHDHAQQTRKHKLLQYYLFQHADWIKPQLKALADRLWRARVVYKKPRAKREPNYFWWYGSDPWGNGQGSEIVRRADFKMRIPFILRLARLYDTHQAVTTYAKSAKHSSFGELAEYMQAVGLKPSKSMQDNIRRAATLAEIDEVFKQVEQRLGGSGVSPAPSPLAGGGVGVRPTSELLDRHGWPLSATIDGVTPKENPPGETGGDRGAPPQYSGDYQRGAQNGAD
jgi:hypothetical protein